MPPDPTGTPTPAVKQVQVKVHAVSVSLHDILTPLMQIGVPPHTAPASTVAGGAPPELDAHLAQMRQAATDLKALVEKIDLIDPTLLMPTQRP